MRYVRPPRAFSHLTIPAAGKPFALPTAGIIEIAAVFPIACGQRSGGSARESARRAPNPPFRDGSHRTTMADLAGYPVSRPAGATGPRAAIRSEPCTRHFGLYGRGS